MLRLQLLNSLTCRWRLTKWNAFSRQCNHRAKQIKQKTSRHLTRIQHSNVSKCAQRTLFNCELCLQLILFFLKSALNVWISFNDSSVFSLPLCLFSFLSSLLFSIITMESANFILIQMNNTILMSVNHLTFKNVSINLFFIENNLNIYLKSSSLSIIAFLFFFWNDLQNGLHFVSYIKSCCPEYRANVGESLLGSSFGAGVDVRTNEKNNIKWSWEICNAKTVKIQW